MKRKDKKAKNATFSMIARQAKKSFISYFHRLFTNYLFRHNSFILHKHSVAKTHSIYQLWMIAAAFLLFHDPLLYNIFPEDKKR